VPLIKIGGGQVRSLNDGTVFNPMSESQRILIVSNNADFPRAELERQHLELKIASDCATAFDVLMGAPFDLLVVDFARARDGIEFIKRVRNTPQLTGILILIMADWGTGEPSLALSAGADAFEPNEGKTIDPRRLITSIERLLSRQVAAAKLTTL
jgi:DNA-binding response OmpR family regulator